jgi:hypothetical protein
MTETKFLVFTECGGYQNSDPDVGHSVEEIACWLAKEGHVPVAWCEGEAMGGSTWLEDCRAESIAAGRTIEQIDGRYVPRGVPVEDKPAKSIGAKPSEDHGGGSGGIAPSTDEPELLPLRGWEQWNGRRAYVPTASPATTPHPSRFALICADLEPRGYQR